MLIAIEQVPAPWTLQMMMKVYRIRRSYMDNRTKLKFRRLEMALWIPWCIMCDAVEVEKVGRRVRVDASQNDVGRSCFLDSLRRSSGSFSPFESQLTVTESRADLTLLRILI